MNSLSNEKVPVLATQALEIVEEFLGRSIIGVYLFGSAVKGGLRIRWTTLHSYRIRKRVKKGNEER